MNVVANTNRIAKNTGYLYLRMILVTVVSLYTSRIVLQTLGFEDFGIYNVVASIVVFFSFINHALKNACTRYLSCDIGANDHESLKRTYSMAINLHLILAFGAFVLLEIIGTIIINGYLDIDPERLVAANWVFQFSLITFCLSTIQIPFDANIIAHEHMDYYAIISIAEALGKLGVAFLLIVSPIDKLVMYGALMMLIAVLVFMGYFIYCKVKLTDSHYIRIWDRKIIEDFAVYSGWSLLVNASDVAIISARGIFFNVFLGVVANAALGIANQIYNAIAMFSRNFASAFTPQIFKSYASGDKEYFYKLIYTTSKISYYLMILPLLPLLINLPFVLELWLDDYPNLTEKYVSAMLLFAVLDAIQAPLWNAIYATGNIKTHQIMMATLKLLVLPLTWLALRLGDNGVWALLIWSFVNLICAIVRTLYSKTFLHIDLWHYVKDVIGRTMLVTIMVAPLPFYIVHQYGQGWITLGSTTLLTCVLLPIVAYYFGLGSAERQQIQIMIKSKLK